MPAADATAAQQRIRPYADPQIDWYVDWRDRHPGVATGPQPATVEFHRTRTYDRITTPPIGVGRGSIGRGATFTEIRTSTTESILVR